MKQLSLFGESEPVPQEPVVRPTIRYVDLDGTLARDDEWFGPLVIGEPIPAMVAKVQKWLADGDEVIIFTARMGPASEYVPKNMKVQIRKAVRAWCREHLGVVLEVTSNKGSFDVGYDDRMRHIVKNTGLTIEEFLLAKINDGVRANLSGSRVLGIVVDYLKHGV